MHVITAPPTAGDRRRPVTTAPSTPRAVWASPETEFDRTGEPGLSSID